MMQRMQSRRGGPGGGVIGNTGPILSPYEQAEGRMRGLPEGGPGGGVMGPRQGPPGRGGLTPGGPGYNPGGPGTWVGRGGIPGGGMPGTMGEGPGGRLEMEGRARQAKRGMMQGRGGPRGRMMSQAQNRFGALTQGAPGGGSFGKPMPGRRIAPPPGKYPGGGNPMTGGRNPMIRGAGRRGGRGGRGGRGMYR